MRSPRSSILLAAVVLSFACGPGESQQDVEKKVSKKQYAGPVRKPTEKREQKPSQTRIAGTGGKSAGGGLQDLKLALAWGDDKKVSGKLEANGNSYEVKGVMDGTDLRCWLTSGTDSSETARRGTLIGQRGEDNSYQGTFAISNSGASEVSGGSWTASPK